MTGRVRAVAVLAVAAVTLAGCGAAGERAEPSTSATPKPSFSYQDAPCPNPIYAGLPAADLPPTAECGYLTVPQNRADPSSRTIKLPVARLKSTAQQPAEDPVVYLAGGPGDTPLIGNFDGWQLDRDLILLGQRGTMKSQPFLACPTYDNFLAEAIGLSVEDPKYARRSAAAVKDCRQRIAAEVVDAAAYNSTESAADVADLRVALGIADWNLYGVSYGTDLALQVLRDHPDGVRSAVLDSVQPPQVNPVESGWALAAQSFTAIFDACTLDAACAQRFPDVRNQFTRLVNELSAKPITVTVQDPSGRQATVVIDGYKLASGVVAASTQAPGQFFRVPLMIDKLANGDPGEVAAALVRVPPPGLVGRGLRLGVLCAEQAARTSAEKVLVAGKLALPDFPEAVLRLPAGTPSVFTDCEQWQVPAAPAAVAGPVDSAVPVLLASGSFDAMTPQSLAEEAARTLTRRVSLVFAGSGHEVARNTPGAAACFLAVMRDFYDRPSDYRTDCVRTLRNPPFATG